MTHLHVTGGHPMNSRGGQKTHHANFETIMFVATFVATSTSGSLRKVASRNQLINHCMIWKAGVFVDTSAPSTWKGPLCFPHRERYAVIFKLKFPSFFTPLAIHCNLGAHETPMASKKQAGNLSTSFEEIGAASMKPAINALRLQKKVRVASGPGLSQFRNLQIYNQHIH